VTDADGFSGSSDVVKISVNGSSVSYIVTGTGVDTSSSLRDIVDEGSEDGNSVLYAVVGANVDGISGSSEVVETFVDDGVSVFVDVVETFVDGCSGLSLMSSSRGPLVLSIATDVSELSIISAPKTCVRFEPVTFSFSKAIASYCILFKDKSRI